jgi:hypothetical protein
VKHGLLFEAFCTSRGRIIDVLGIIFRSIDSLAIDRKLNPRSFTLYHLKKQRRLIEHVDGMMRPSNTKESAMH